MKKQRHRIAQVFSRQSKSHLHAAAPRANNLPRGCGDTGNRQGLRLCLARLEQRALDLSGRSSNDLRTLRSEIFMELRTMNDSIRQHQERFDERLRQAESRLDKNEGKSIVLSWLFVPIIGGVVGLFFVVIQRML